MVFALTQPFALVGLVVGLAAAATVRHLVQSAMLQQAVASPADSGRNMWLHPLGVVAACVSGTGFGVDRKPAPDVSVGRARLCVLAGPIAVLLTGRVLLELFRYVWPDERFSGLYLPSDVLHGVPEGATGPVAQTVFTAAVAMMAFGLVSLLPLPPADGWRLWGHAPSRLVDLLEGQAIGSVLLLVLLIVPVGDLPVAHRLLDTIAVPLLRW